MFDYFKTYYAISPFFFTLTASASLLFSVSNLALIFGTDYADDLPGMDHVPSDVSFKFFTTQSVLAFFMGLGWGGMTSTYKWQLAFPTAFLIGGGFGLCLMVLSAFLMSKARSLNNVRAPNLYSCVGIEAKVYATIPAACSGSGHITVVVGGQQKTVRAVTKGGELPSFSSVQVVALHDSQTVIVEPISIQAFPGEKE